MKLTFFALSGLLLVMSLSGTTLALECIENDYGLSISNVYSDIENCDISISSSKEIRDMSLEMQLEHEGMVLEKRVFSIASVSPASATIKAFQWDVDNRDDGRFTVRSRLLKDGCELDSNVYSFVNGRQVIPRITVDDLVVNSEGFSVMITPQEAVLIDLEYMLLDDTDVIFTDRVEKIGLHTQPFVISRNWNTLLENGKLYSGRIKVKMYSPSENYIAAMEEFTAKDDVFISDTYKDEIGASATLDGISQVPFMGSVRFTVIRESTDGDEIIESATKRSPVLLNGDDETVEAIWKKRLPEGIYKLTIEVIGNDDDILDVRETIIEAEAVTSAPTSIIDNSENNKESPGFPGIHVLFTIIAAIFVIRLIEK